MARKARLRSLLDRPHVVLTRCLFLAQAWPHPDEFHHHYEKSHTPLLLRLLGPVFPKSHTRFYLPRQPSNPSPGDTSNANYALSVFIGNTDDFDYDVFASVIFESLLLARPT